MVFTTMAISSASSGLLLNKSGWHAVNYGSIPFLVLATAATLWLMWQRRSGVRERPVFDELSQARGHDARDG